MIQTNYDYSLITDDDLYLFNEGSHFRLYDKLGAHPLTIPVNGKSIFPYGAQCRSSLHNWDFNQWDGTRHLLQPEIILEYGKVVYPG